jgi:hypothetical protein
MLRGVNDLQKQLAWTTSKESVFAVSARAIELPLSFVGPVAIHNTDIFHPMCRLGTELPW